MLDGCTQVDLVDSNLTGNVANNHGGALWSSGSVTAAISGSNMSANTAAHGASAMAQQSSTLEVVDSMIKGNKASWESGYGGLTVRDAAQVKPDRKQSKRQHALAAVGLLRQCIPNPVEQRA